MKRIFGLILLLAFIAVPAGAKDHTYQSGMLVDVTETGIDTGLLFGRIVYFCCVLEIRGEAFAYSVYIAKRPEQIDLRTDEAVRFRIHNQDVFIKRPNGKELKARLLKTAPASSVGPPANPLRRSVLPGEKQYETGTVRSILAAPKQSKSTAGYVLEIETKNTPTYCTSTEQHESSYRCYAFIEQRRYISEWPVGGPIQFRIEWPYIYLKRIDGKELKAESTSGPLRLVY